MKKTILLATLAASLVSVAKTTGSVEFFNENTGSFNAGQTKGEYTVNKAGVKTEVKVDGTGLSFGGEFKVEDVKVPMEQNKPLLNNLFNHSNLFVKYELPQIKGVNSYVKGTLNPKAGKGPALAFEEGNAELEADVNYEVAKDIKLGVNTKTTFPFKGTDYAKAVTSTHKAYVKGNYAPIKDIKAEVEVKHSYKSTANTNDALKYLSLLAEAKYDVMKDLELNGQFKFKYNFNDEIKLENLGDKDLLEIAKALQFNEMKYAHSYVLGAKYTGLKNTEINVKGFVGHASDKKAQTPTHIVHYGVKGDVKYTGVENLTLTGKATLAGVSELKTPTHTGIFEFGVGAKYDYKVSDKFTVSPEFNGDVNFYTTAGLVANTTLTLTPKVSAEYKPIEELKVSGSIAVPVKFAGDPATFNYTNTSVKTALNIKYEWK